MKTVTDTPDSLVLDETPWLLGLGIVGLVLVFAGVGWVMLFSGEIIGGLMFLIGGVGPGGLALWAFVRRTQLWIDGGSGLVALRTRSVLGFTEKTLPLADLETADLEQSRSSKGQITRRAILRFGGKSASVVPVTGYYTSGRGPLRTAENVNAWLARHRSGTASRST